VHVNYSIWRWVGASNNDPAQGLHTLKSGPDCCARRVRLDRAQPMSSHGRHTGADPRERWILGDVHSAGTMLSPHSAMTYGSRCLYGGWIMQHDSSSRPLRSLTRRYMLFTTRRTSVARWMQTLPPQTSAARDWPLPNLYSNLNWNSNP